MEQHYRMTLQDAIAKYHAGDITIKGLIHFYILIKCKPGWKIKIDYESIRQILPVSKSSFYHVISCLKKEGFRGNRERETENREDSCLKTICLK
ncbi:hypothetical protein NIES4075_73090 [Tolypothrix sp. NIES-4075]|nr:hypothetical protein NIES4075_73090 [Tolypothrix sp. NIES-4075]